MNQQRHQIARYRPVTAKDLEGPFIPAERVIAADDWNRRVWGKGKVSGKVRRKG